MTSVVHSDSNIRELEENAIQILFQTQKKPAFQYKGNTEKY